MIKKNLIIKKHQVLNKMKQKLEVFEKDFTDDIEDKELKFKSKDFTKAMLILNKFIHNETINLKRLTRKQNKKLNKK